MPLGKEDIAIKLRTAIARAGDVTKFAASQNMTEGYVRRVLRDGKPGKRLADFLGVKEIRGQWEEVK